MQTNTTSYIKLFSNPKFHSHYNFYISMFANISLVLQKVSVTSLCLFLYLQIEICHGPIKLQHIKSRLIINVRSVE